MAWTDEPSTTCGKPGVRIIVGCVHEHVQAGYACARCLKLIQLGGLHCMACQDAGHYCEATIRVVK